MLGSSVSSIVNVAVVDVALLQSSVAVNVTVALPVAPQSSLKAVKSLLQVTPLHTSLADAPPLASNHAVKAAVLPDPSHSTVSSEDTVSIDGLVVSSTVKVADVSAGDVRILEAMLEELVIVFGFDVDVSKDSSELYLQVSN